MSTTASVQQAWAQYQQAWRDLYSGGTAERGVATIATTQFEARSATLLSSSQELRDVLTIALETEHEDQRELAALKLVAASAYDLSVANDLMGQEQGGLTDQGERGVHNVLFGSHELNSVLDAPLSSGLSGLLEIERAVLPTSPQAAAAQFKETIDTTLKAIPQDVASLCVAVLAGVGGTGLSVLPGLSTITQEALALIPAKNISLAVRRAAQFAMEAVQKLWATLGKDQQQQVQKQATSWLTSFFQNQNMVVALLNKLYETERIRQEIVTLIRAAPSTMDAASYNRATQELEELSGRYDKIKSVLQLVIRVWRGASPFLLVAVPWGPITVYSAYLGIFGYAVYSGGDYLDWYRTKEFAWLDRVQGLRSIVHQALSA